MKIESPSSITPREASVKLEWISTRILPGVAVLLISIPLCQWANSVFPKDIIPVYVTYLICVTVLGSIYMAVQYAFIGIVQTKKTKSHTAKNLDEPCEQAEQEPILLLEAIPSDGETMTAETVCEEETIDEPTYAEVIEEASEPVVKETSEDNNVTATYQQGIDDFYQSQAESQKKKLATIKEYVFYIMSPFIHEEDMEEFSTDLLKFAMDHNYRPETEWKRFKGKLSSFDVRHLVWSIATRLGLGKGKPYSNDDCACYIELRFASLCVTANGEPLSHNTLKNLTVTSNSDQIHSDNPGIDGLLFHIPSQLGIKEKK